MGAGEPPAEDVDGLAQAAPIGVPVVGAAHAGSPVAVEEFRGGQVDGHADLVRAGLLEGQQVVAVDDRGRDEQRHRDVEALAQPAADSFRVPGAAAVGQHGDADALDPVPARGDGLGDVVQGMRGPGDADEALSARPVRPLAGQAAVGAAGGAARRVGEKQVDAGKPRVAVEEPRGEAQGHGGGQAQAEIVRAFPGVLALRGVLRRFHRYGLQGRGGPVRARSGRAGCHHGFSVGPWRTEQQVRR